MITQAHEEICLELETYWKAKAAKWRKRAKKFKRQRNYWEGKYREALAQLSEAEADGEVVTDVFGSEGS